MRYFELFCKSKYSDATLVNVPVLDVTLLPVRVAETLDTVDPARVPTDDVALSPVNDDDALWRTVAVNVPRLAVTLTAGASSRYFVESCRRR